MMGVHLWAYKQDHFYTSSRAPICADGNAADDTVRLPPDAIRWDRTLGFTHIDDLVTGVRGVAGGAGGGANRIDALAIMCHGMPGGLALLSEGILTTNRIATYGPKLTELNQALHPAGRSGTPLVMFMACSAAAPPRGTELFELISSWMSGTRIIGFRTLLTTDATTPRELPEDRICLPPDLRVTSEAYDEARAIDQQSGSAEEVDASTLPAALPRSIHACEFRDGALVWESRDPRGGGEGQLRRATRSHRGRGRGGAPRVD
jgi:hypothetical protein